MKTKLISRPCLILSHILTLLLTTIVSGQEDAPTPQKVKSTPVVLGYGKGAFHVGPILKRDNFENLDQWVIQLQNKSGMDEGHVKAVNNSLNCLVPRRGCTVWFKEKLPPRVAIIYEVICPDNPVDKIEIIPRDINNFWMASDPVDPDLGLFDLKRYTGAFRTYHKMSGYYASTGGAKIKPQECADTLVN